MSDVAVVVALIAFFGLCVLFVRACDHIIRDDEQ
jgi:hypothetical protein